MSTPTPLPVLAEADFDEDTPPHAWVTFLNRSLKRHGFVFGVSDHGSGFRLTVYRTDPWSPPERKDGCP